MSAIKSKSDLPQITYMSADFSVRADDLSAGSMGLADRMKWERRICKRFDFESSARHLLTLA